jgi:small subunit ribosomal protein S16
MLMIRLQRVGKKNSPAFRVVLVDSRRSSKSSAIKDIVGFYEPKKANVPQFDVEKIKDALSHGAQASKTIYNFLIDAKIIEDKKKNVLHLTRIGKKKEKNALKKEEQPVAAVPEAEKEIKEEGLTNS